MDEGSGPLPERGARRTFQYVRCAFKFRLGVSIQFAEAEFQDFWELLALGLDSRGQSIGNAQGDAGHIWEA
jgi:hypothetical protein